MKTHLYTHPLIIHVKTGLVSRWPYFSTSFGSHWLRGPGKVFQKLFANRSFFNIYGVVLCCKAAMKVFFSLHYVRCLWLLEIEGVIKYLFLRLFEGTEIWFFNHKTYRNETKSIPTYQVTYSQSESRGVSISIFMLGYIIFKFWTLDI